MGEHFDRLRLRLADISNLNKANAVLGWDQSTYMPPAGANARGEQMATVGRIAHDLFVADVTGDLLVAARDEVEALPEDSDERCIVRVLRRDFDQARKVPPALVGEMLRHQAVAYQVWTEAREADDFPRFAPCLERTVDFSRQLAGYLGYAEQPYDALLDQYEPGMRTSQVVALFDAVKPDLVALVHAIADQAAAVDDAFVHQSFDEARQEEFGVMVARMLGYDFSRGRLDRTAHPFQTSFSINDVRITTRYFPDYLPSALFSTIHEAGHAMYEQGISPSLEGTPLADGTSLGVHESQSRMWENVVGRSRPFWRHLYPSLQRIFPVQLGDVDTETFYRAINRVQPSLIRIEADEVTYNLHIMLRLEMELALLSGDLAVADAPAAWNEKMDAYLGLRPATDRDGILQDVHWSSGLFGYFSTYSLGNFLSVQLFDAAVRAHPGIPEEIEQGQFDTLRGWLTENIYRHGRKFEPNQLIERATGEPMQSRSYMRYLKEKFTDMYDLAA